MAPYELRSLRRASGLSLAAVARAAGTSASNVSAYERGAKRASDATLARLCAAVRAGSDSPIHRNRLVTVPAAAAAIRSGLRQGWSTGDLLRIVRELRSNARHLRNDSDRFAFSHNRRPLATDAGTHFSPASLRWMPSATDRKSRRGRADTTSRTCGSSARTRACTRTHSCTPPRRSPCEASSSMVPRWSPCEP